MRRLPALAALVAAFALLACGDDPAPPAAGPADPAPPPTSPAPDPAPDPPPVAVQPRAGTPYACIPGDASRGREKYETFCASCHGKAGDGEGPAAAGLNPKPARHDDGTIMNPLTNEFLFEVIKDGGAAVGKSPLMAAWGGTLSGEQVWDVVAFVRTLAKPPYACP